MRESFVRRQKIVMKLWVRVEGAREFRLTSEGGDEAPFKDWACGAVSNDARRWQRGFRQCTKMYWAKTRRAKVQEDEDTTSEALLGKAVGSNVRIRL